MIGKILAEKYEIVRVLGSGGMGEVYEAKHVGTGRRAAIKLIQSVLSYDDGVVARFQREARAAGAIESQHITQVFDAGKDPETNAPFIVMEFLSGEDIDVLTKRLGPLRPSLALRIIGQALAGLERAHAAKVIHRDIKPANLFLAEADGGRRVVKLVDFGIAKVKDDLAASRDHALTQTSSLLGSPMYMSPEQAKSSKHVDGRADIWSLGIVFYQLLAGTTPHGHTESLTELLLAICTEPAKPVQQVAPWVSAEITAIVQRALAIDANQRWSSAGEMLAAIGRVQPDWAVITSDMLTPLTAEERAVRAPGAEPVALAAPAPSAPAMPIVQQTMVHTPAPITPHTPAPITPHTPAPIPPQTPAPISNPVPYAPSTTSSPLSTSHVSTSSSRPWLGFAIAGGGLLVVLLVVGGLFASGAIGKKEATATGTGLVPSASATMDAPSAAPSVTAAPSETAAASASASAVPTPSAAPTPNTVGVKPKPIAPTVATSSTPTATPPATTSAKPKPTTAPTSSSPISREFN